jgi:opacity protein-like surface antigen
MNTKIALFAVVAAFTAAAPTMAQDAPENFYVRLGGGLSQPEDSSIDIRAPVGTPVRGRDISFDMGFMLSAAAGYRFDNGFRTELEGNYRKANANDLDNASASGSQRVFGLMANVLYDMGNSTSFFPYVGGGLGVAWNKWNNVQGSPSATWLFGTPDFNDRDTSLQFQAIGGVTVPFTEVMDGFVEYRFIGTVNNKFHSVPPGSTASRHNDRSHNLLIGVRFNL